MTLLRIFAQSRIRGPAEASESRQENPSNPMARRPRFNERKATQVAARILASVGGRMPYLSLMKLMYFIDRAALLRWGTPLTNDAYFSMDNGPVLSRVKDLMTEEDPAPGFWSHHISSPTNYRVELIDEAGNDQLSPAEERLIDEIVSENRGLDRWKLVEKSHKLPEWKHPNGSSTSIEIDDILEAGGIGAKQREEMVRELESVRRVQALLVD